jgi:ABC-2 type transport system ATP-binding protein
MENRLIRNLSKGYRQRVGLAQAVLGYPEIIILDEPTVGLDPKQIIEIRDLIRRLGEKHTVILSSHILSEVREVCDYIFIISQGKLVASDTTENLLQQVQKSQTIRLLTDENPDAFVSVLYEVPGVTNVTVEENDNMTNCILVDAEEGKDIRKAVFKKIAESGLTLLEMQSAGRTLEDIFLELTEIKEVKEEIAL